MSAARHAFGAPDPSAGERSSTNRGPVVPLLVIVLGLAVAAIWFVALPMLERAPKPDRTCEVIVLQSGKTKCVADPKSRSGRPAKRP